MPPRKRRLDESMEPSVVRVDDSLRRAHFLSLLPVTSTEMTANETVRSPVGFRVYNEVAGWLAWSHLNDPDKHILAGVGKRLQNCDISFTMEFRDTRFSALNAARELLDAFSHQLNASRESILRDRTKEQLPVALLGAARSAVSSTLSILGSAYALPQISSSSTSAALDNKESYPYFARTVPSNEGDAFAAATYLKHLGVTQLGILYIEDSFGTNYHADLAEKATQLGIKVISVRYEDESSDLTIQRLQRSGVRYIFAIVNPSTWRILFGLAVQYGIMGVPDYTWFLSEASSELAQSSFELDRKLDAKLIRGIHGVGILSISLETYEPFKTAMIKFSGDEEQQSHFISQHKDSATIFRNFTFPAPGESLYQYLTYDAVTALGLAACEAPSDELSGYDLYQQLLQTEFLGVSGPVSFTETTGTRQGEDFAYRIQNILIADDLSGDTVVRFTSETSMLVDLRTSSFGVRTVRPFVYTDNSTHIPLDLPPLVKDLNLLSTAARASGLVMGALVMVLSIAFLAWTLAYKDRDIVRASQPIFLIQLCMGTFFMAAAVIPLSLQEPINDKVLDIACMSVPWFLSTGFAVAFSALFSKTWRLNRLFNSGRFMRRIVVRPRDVMLPFVGLMTINLGLLTAWTIHLPLRWERVPLANFDVYERSVESYGTCLTGSKFSSVYVAPIVAIDMAALVVASYQAYKARNLPTDYSESTYLALAMISLLEVVIIAAPLLFLGTENQTSAFLIRSILICVVCLAILLPIFGPKIVLQNRKVFAPSATRGKFEARNSSAPMVSQSSFVWADEQGSQAPVFKQANEADANAPASLCVDLYSEPVNVVDPAHAPAERGDSLGRSSRHQEQRDDEIDFVGFDDDVANTSVKTQRSSGSRTEEMLAVTVSKAIGFLTRN